MEGLLQGRVICTFEEFKKKKNDRLFHYVVDLILTLVPFVFDKEHLSHFELIVSHFFDVFKSYCLENDEFNTLVLKFFDLIEKYLNYDHGNATVLLAKYSYIISALQKAYPEVGPLKNVNSTISLLLLSSSSTNKASSCSTEISLYIPKVTTRFWSAKQLEPFVKKLLNRDNFDDVFKVLQELENVSQRQPLILNDFVYYLSEFFVDSSDAVRDLAITLVLRFLKLNPKESYAFLDVYAKCLNHENSKIFQSALKIFPDFTFLCSEKSQYLLRNAFIGGVKHNHDITKCISDALRLLQLDKHIY